MIQVYINKDTNNNNNNNHNDYNKLHGVLFFPLLEDNDILGWVGGERNGKERKWGFSFC